MSRRLLLTLLVVLVLIFTGCSISTPKTTNNPFSTLTPDFSWLTSLLTPTTTITPPPTTTITLPIATTPPVYTPPSYTPPVYTPPVYTPPVITPPSSNPTSSCTCYSYTLDKYIPCDQATAICRDGTCSISKSRSGTCSWHGGVARWIN